MLPSTADAVAASVAVATALGLPSDRPVVVAEGYSVRVRLAPAEVLTRVVTAGRRLRGEPAPWMLRELATSTFLAASGAPVARPWSDPGPHRGLGLDVTLWQWFETDSKPVTPHVYGRLLRSLHDALEGIKVDLPLLAGPLTDIECAIGATDDPVLHSAAARLLPLAMTWPRRPLHGDAHTGNLLSTPFGFLWTDFEDVCVGPVEWDLASRTIDSEFVDAYPGTIDRELLEDCRDLRCLQILAAILVSDVQDTPLYDELTARLVRRQGARR
ncbi:MAG TPA: aminoglycoside phosphotransferase family protein [Mycobacteriales bacterium]|nr:aminoglycoside phosphotransferase family protein [Mycobacteriales bacterium]